MFVLAVLTLLGPVVAGADERMPQPFHARYAVEWRGMSAGNSTLELKKTGPGTYTYQSRNVARGIFRLAVPGAVTQTSSFRIVDGRVLPQTYTADDGSRGTERDVRLEFDWNRGRVTGTAEDRPVDEALQSGTQDALSVQIALMRELAAGRSPQSFWLIDKDEAKEYRYSAEDKAIVETPLGPLETVIYRSERPGSSRVTRMWLAPSLGYLPVRAEQRRRGKVEFAMNIRELTRSPDAAEQPAAAASQP